MSGTVFPIHPNLRCEMKKLTLDTETLRVDSFAVAAEARPVDFLGAVVAATAPHVCDPFTMGPRCP